METKCRIHSDGPGKKADEGGKRGAFYANGSCGCGVVGLQGCRVAGLQGCRVVVKFGIICGKHSFSVELMQ